MRIVCLRGDLLGPVSHAASVVPARPMKEALGFLRLIKGKDGLRVHATDNEVHVLAQVPFQKVDADGEVLLPAGQLLAILKAIPDGEVVLESGDSVCTLTGNGSEYTLPLGVADSLPDYPEVNGESVEIDAEALAAVAFAAASDAGRYAMCGVHVGVDAVVATDGRRLAKREVSRVGKLTATIPSKAVDLVARIGGKFEALLSKNRASFAWYDDEGEFTLSLTTLLVDGRFPDYAAVWPKEQESTRVLFAKGELEQAIKRAALLADPESKRMEVAIRKGGVELSAKAANGGRSKVAIEPEEAQGAHLEFSVNPGYLLDAIKHAAGDQVSLLCYGDKKPLMVEGVEYACLIMPLV